MGLLIYTYTQGTGSVEYQLMEENVTVEEGMTVRFKENERKTR